MEPSAKGVALLSFSFQKGIYLATFHGMNPLARKLQGILNELGSDWLKIAETIGVPADYLLEEIEKYRMDKGVYQRLEEIYDANKGLVNGTTRSNQQESGRGIQQEIRGEDIPFPEEY